MAKLTVEFATEKLAGHPLVENIVDEGVNGFTVWAKPGCGWMVGDSIRPATQFLPGTAVKHFHLEIERLRRCYDAPLADNSVIDGPVDFAETNFDDEANLGDDADETEQENPATEEGS